MHLWLLIYSIIFLVQLKCINRLLLLLFLYSDYVILIIIMIIIIELMNEKILEGKESEDKY